MPQTIIPWVAGVAVQNGTYANSFICSIKSGSFTVGYVNGKTLEECQSNANITALAVNSFYTTQDALKRIRDYIGADSSNASGILSALIVAINGDLGNVREIARLAEIKTL